MTVYIAIFGSRKRHEREKIKSILIEEKIKHGSITVVSGGARGIDEDAQWACKQLGLPILIYYPNRSEYKYKKSQVFFERNEKMAKRANYGHAFPLNMAGGTMNTINHFIKLDKGNNLKIYNKVLIENKKGFTESD